MTTKSFAATSRQSAAGEAAIISALDFHGLATLAGASVAFAALKIFQGRAVALEALAEFLLKRDK